MPQNNARRGMKSNCRRHEKKQRRFGANFYARKIAVARDVVLLLVPANAQPVIRGLQHQMNIFIRFQFQNCQPPVARHAKQVNHCEEYKLVRFQNLVYRCGAEFCYWRRKPVMINVGGVWFHPSGIFSKLS